MESFVFNSFKKRFMQGEVPSTDTWTFKVVNSNLSDYQNIKSFRNNNDFIKIGGEDKYNKVFTEITPIHYYYSELPDLDDDYSTKKPMFITNDNWKEFFKEYKEYIYDWDNATQTWIPRIFYNEQIDLQHLFFNFVDTGEVTENGEPIIKNVAKYADYNGFYWVTTKEELAWCAERVNGEVNGVRGSTFNNKIAIVLGDDIGTNDIDDDQTNIRSCIGKYEDRPFEGLLFGNGYSFVSINLICANNTNGIVGTLGPSGKIHYCRITGNCSITCEKKITLNHLKNECCDVLAGLLCGKNYGEIFTCESTGTVKVNNFVPAVYCVQNKTEESSSNKNPDANMFYPNYMCINNPGNIIPYVGYFNEGVFAASTVYQTLTVTSPSSTKSEPCSSCYGQGIDDTCDACRGLGYAVKYNASIGTYESACNACGGEGTTTGTTYRIGRGFNDSSKCTVCSGYGYLSAECSEDEYDDVSTVLTYGAPTDWVVPSAEGMLHFEITCTACYGTMNKNTCRTCSGTGIVSAVNEEGEETDAICNVCDGHGISALCTTCSGHVGTMYTTEPMSTYSAYMMKQWAASKSNKLDNTGVTTIVTNNLNTTEMKNALNAGATVHGFTTFYDYKQVSHTIELAGLSGTPNYIDAMVVSGTKPEDMILVPLVTTATTSAYSALNGYSDINGSTVPLANASTIYADITDNLGNDTNAASLIPILSTRGQRDELVKAGIIPTTGTYADSNFTPYGVDSTVGSDGAVYRYGALAMPNAILDQSIKLNAQSRAAYYVSPLVGMNKSTIGNCYVDEDFSSDGSFVGFFGGVVGKQCGGWIYNTTVNLDAIENEKRDIFTASAEHAIDAKDGIFFGSRPANADPITLYVRKTWNEPLVVPYLDENKIKRYIELRTDDGANFPVQNLYVYKPFKTFNNIKAKMRRHVDTNWTKILNMLGIDITVDDDKSASDPMIPALKGFNLSFSGFSGATYISRTVLDFNINKWEPTASQQEITAAQAANSAFYMAYREKNVCSVGYPGFNWDENLQNGVITGTVGLYDYLPNEQITHEEYVNGEQTNDVLINNYYKKTPIVVAGNNVVDPESSRWSAGTKFYKFAKTQDGGLRGDSVSSVGYSTFIKEVSANPSEVSAYIAKSYRAVQKVSECLVNYLEFSVIQNSVQWARTSAEDGTIYYQNTSPICVPVYTFYDEMSASFYNSIEIRKLKKKDNYYTVLGMAGTEAPKVKREASYFPMKLNVDMYSATDTGEKVKYGTAYPYIQMISIDYMRCKETEPYAVHTNDSMFKTAQIEVDAVSGILLAGAVYDDENLTRTDYKIYIPEFDQADSVNFIDKCASEVDVTTNTIKYSDKYVRDPKRSNTEIFKRNDGIYNYLNDTTWDQQRRFNTLNTIFYYTYYDVNFEDINDYSCTLYSIRNVGALAGSMVLGNKQFLTNNNAFLNNKQGLLYQEPKRDLVPYIKINSLTYDHNKSGIELQYLEVVNSELPLHPTYYGANGNKVYTSNLISDGKNVVYPVDPLIKTDKIAIRGIYPTDKDDRFSNMISTIDGTSIATWGGNELFTCYRDTSATISDSVKFIMPDMSAQQVTQDTLCIDNGVCYIPASAVTGAVGNYTLDGDLITENSKLGLYAMGLGPFKPVNALGVLMSDIDETTNAGVSEYVQVINYTSGTGHYTSAFVDSQTAHHNFATEYSALSGTYSACKVTFGDNFPPSLSSCKYEYEMLNDRTYFDEKHIVHLYKGTIDAMKPVWKDYNLLNRYGAMAAICEYNTANIEDKMLPGHTYNELEIAGIRPVYLENNTFAYHEHTIAGENSMQYGPMKLGGPVNLLSNHVGGHKIYGIASPLIAELKPVAKSISSIVQYTNGAFAGQNEAGLFREGEVNQYMGMFTTDMGIRCSVNDPYGWVTNDAIDIPGSPNLTLNNTSNINILWNPDTRGIANTLFDWRNTKVEPGNVTVTGAITVNNVTSENRSKTIGYHEPYTLEGQGKSFTNELFVASNGKCANMTYDSKKKYKISYEVGPTGTENVGYGYTYNPVQTITVPYNSFKDTLSNAYPAAIYGFSDITRYKDVKDTVSEYDNVESVYDGMYYKPIVRGDYDQLISPYQWYRNPWELYKNRKHRNRYPYFGSSLRLIRDDEADFITVPGYNNVRDGKYINDCVPSYVLEPTNVPIIDNPIVNEEQGYIPAFRPPVNIKPITEYTYDKFEYTYTTAAAEPFSAFKRDVLFAAVDNKLGYWAQSNVSAGFLNDTVTYSGTKELRYNGNIFTLGYTKLPDQIRTEIVNSSAKYSYVDDNGNTQILNGYSFTSGVSGTDIQGLLVQDSSGNNVMYIDMGLGDCDGLTTWSYSAHPSHNVSGNYGLLLEIGG